MLHAKAPAASPPRRSGRRAQNAKRQTPNRANPRRPCVRPQEVEPGDILAQALRSILQTIEYTRALELRPEEAAYVADRVTGALQ